MYAHARVACVGVSQGTRSQVRLRLPSKQQPEHGGQNKGAAVPVAEKPPKESPPTGKRGALSHTAASAQTGAPRDPLTEGRIRSCTL